MTNDQKTSPTLARLANRPSTYLVYLAFFFVAMAFTPVDTADIVAAIIAVAVFLPLHFIGFHAAPRTRITTIVGLMLICVATASFLSSFRCTLIADIRGIFWLYFCIGNSIVFAK